MHPGDPVDSLAFLERKMSKVLVVAVHVDRGIEPAPSARPTLRATVDLPEPSRRQYR